MPKSYKPASNNSMRVDPRKQIKYHHTSPHDQRGGVSNILAVLPRELRNRIYTFCLQGAYDNEVIVRRAGFGQTYRFTHLIREPCGQYSYQWIEDPVAACLSKNSYDPSFSREMLECYYWTRTFKFAHHELCLLGPFLQTDDFGLGMIPAVYTRRLQIQIQPLLFAFLLPDSRAIEEQRCCSAIESLYSIQTSRTEIAIEVDLTQGTLSDADYEQFSDAAAKFTAKIKGVVDRLKERSLRVALRTVGAEIQNETRTTASDSRAASNTALTSLEMAIPQKGS